MPFGGLVALAAIIVVVLATSGASSSDNATGSKAGKIYEPTAPTVGVTDDAIRVGLAYTDPAVTQLFGAPASDVPSKKDVLNYFLAGIGDDTVINGRKIEIFPAAYQATDQSDPVRQCIKLTEDDKVFAVVSQRLVAGGAQCVAGQHKRILLVDQIDNDKTFQTAPGLVFSMSPSNARIATDLADYLIKSGKLKGQTIGVLTSAANGGKPTIDASLVPTLEKAGYKIAAETNLSGDVNVQQTQFPAAVDLFKSKGVTLVIAVDEGVSVGFFGGQASRAGYHPTWAMSDFGDAINLAGTFTKEMDGAIGVTAVRLWDPDRTDADMSPERKECYDNFKKLGGADITPGGAKFGFLMSYCQLGRTFAAAAKAAGRDLTVQSFSKAMQQLGEVNSTYRGRVAFSPGVFDGGEAVREARFDYRCPSLPKIGCFVPVTSFTETR